MAGRKPLPTKLKEQRGTLKKSRVLENEMNPTLVVTMPEPPAKLMKDSKEVWRKTIPELRAAGVLAIIDMELLTAYCQEMGRYIRIQRLLEKQGEVTETENDDGSVELKINPWYLVAEKSIKLAHAIGTSFGLTPSSRSKIQSAPAKKPGIADLLKPKHG